jgi:RNA recognition motif-containing protein
MSFTVFLGNLPVWVTADDIRSWLTAEGLVSDAVKVIRNPETQESKGFAFIDAPNAEEMNDRAPLEDRLLRANPAQPPKSKNQKAVEGVRGSQQPQAPAAGAPAGAAFDRNRRGGKKHKRPTAPQSAFAEELAKAL